jgi:hypothetical protein
VFVLCVRFSVFVYRKRPCGKLITSPRSPTDCPRSSNCSETDKIYGGYEGLNWTVEPKNQKKMTRASFKAATFG